MLAVREARPNREHAAADAVARLEDADRCAVLTQVVRRGKAGESRSGNHDRGAREGAARHGSRISPPR